MSSRAWDEQIKLWELEEVDIDRFREHPCQHVFAQRRQQSESCLKGEMEGQIRIEKRQSITMDTAFDASREPLKQQWVVGHTASDEYVDYRKEQHI
jgi:hypothetical protein